MKILPHLLALLALGTPLLNAQNQTRNRGAGVAPEVLNAFQALNFHGMPYRFLLPENYDPGNKYPLILNLHGRAGIGDDNVSQMRNWTAVFVDEDWRKKYPYVVVAPQSWDSWAVFNERVPELTPEQIQAFSPAWQARFNSGRISTDMVSTGSLTMAILLVDEIARQYGIDTSRVYVMGHSMGGFGSWNAIWAEPGKFAAAIPSAGGMVPWKDATRFKDVPVWTFHGDIDPTVSVEYTRDIFAAIKAAGGNLKYTELKDVRHNAAAYAFYYRGDDPEKGHITHTSSDRCDPTPNVWDWLFRQTLGKGSNARF